MLCTRTDPRNSPVSATLRLQNAIEGRPGVNVSEIPVSCTHSNSRDAHTGTGGSRVSQRFVRHHVPLLLFIGARSLRNIHSFTGEWRLNVSYEYT